MKRKIFVLALIIALFSSAGLSAFGVGLQGDWNAGSSGTGVSLTFKTDAIPLVFAANWNLNEQSQYIGVTGDYWIINNPLTRLGDGSLNWFLGVGFFAKFAVSSNNFNFHGGLRVPVGLNAFLANKVFEPYVQIAPSFGVHFIPSLGADSLFWPVSLGFRIWFK